jgi:ABC-type transporter Mla subunit MlaD
MPDNIEVRMNFIIEQQAQFAADIQLLKERQTDTERMIRQLVDVTMSLAHHAEETNRRQQETERHLAETDRHLRELGEETDRRLNALIDTVDKLVRRNGLED